jgi:hypothetical protein
LRRAVGWGALLLNRGQAHEDIVCEGNIVSPIMATINIGHQPGGVVGHGLDRMLSYLFIGTIIK